MLAILSAITSRKTKIVLRLDDGQTTTKYETELQLFPKKCEVKLQEHLNQVAGREDTPINGQDLRSRIRREKNFVEHRGHLHYDSNDLHCLYGK